MTVEFLTGGDNDSLSPAGYSSDGITWTGQGFNSSDVIYAPELGLWLTFDSALAPTVAKTSPDGTTWTSTALTGSPKNRRFAWNGSVFVSVHSPAAGSDCVWTSSDGIAWTLRSCPMQQLLDVTWSCELDLFVACGVAVTPGSGENVVTSPDGITWTQRTFPSAISTTPRAIAWCEGIGLFVTHGQATADHVWTSPDGETWTKQMVTGDNPDVWTLAWSEPLGLLIGGGIGGTLFSTPDGTAWTANVTVAGAIWRGSAWNDTLAMFCVVGDGGRIRTSVNGGTWTARTSYTASSIRQVAARALPCSHGWVVGEVRM